nr:hypothetical protein [Lachnospiraceae bacterium]
MIKKVTTYITGAVFCIIMLLCLSVRSDAVNRAGVVDFLADYEAIYYDYTKGLISAEINAVTQTNDGYIWIGTYSGLYRYDGYKFEKADIGVEICNVMALFVDSRGKLWVGTNDAGLVCFDPELKESFAYTMDGGLASNSIRSICEDDKGHIIVGTITDISVILLNNEVETYNLRNITGVRTLTNVGDGMIAGVTNGGTLFFEKDGRLVDSLEMDAEGVYYTAISRNEKEDFLVGTSTGIIDRINFSNNRIKLVERYETDDVKYFNDIMYDPVLNGYFFCAENGMGFIQKNDYSVTYLMQNSFNSSVSGVIKDYQGNVWFVSNKQGIIEYSVNPFMDVFVKAEIEKKVVNSVAFKGSELYVGTDDGLYVINTVTYDVRNYGFLKKFEGVRIRHILVDRHRNVWVSTYGVDGLVEIKADGRIVNYNEGEKGTVGGRFRCAIELKDGTIVASSNEGLNFIKNEKIERTMASEEGIEAQILCMMEEEDGTIIAGSDGDGIYYIKDGKITKKKGIEDGLLSQVVLRIISVDEGYIYITSSALFYDNGYSVKKLDSFPYTNNYDIYINEEKEAWVFSSAGIYVLSLEDLLENGDYRYYLLDRARGFTTSLTANSWNVSFSSDNTLFLCCTDGVRRVYTDRIEQDFSNYFIRMNTVTYEDKNIAPESDGGYVIPAGDGRIQIRPSILNYSLSNPLIHIYLEGVRDEGSFTYQANLKPLDYTNLPYGQYTLHVEILDPITRNVLRDETFSIYKKPKFFELFAVKALIFLIVVGVVAGVVWWIIKGTIVRRQYERIREAKEEAERANGAKSRFLANMSHEIRTPINTIMGMDEMILREDRKGDHEEYAKTVTGYAVSIKRASESLLSLINDILDLSKIESGKMNLVEREYVVEELLKSLCLMIRVRSREKELEFNTRIDPSIPKVLNGDDGKIKQIVLNLLTNAV